MQVSLKYFEEVFTSEHWMMRIYRVRDQPLRDSKKDSGPRRTAAKSEAGSSGKKKKKSGGSS
jgi:dolichyl-diphosphooligosaccharide--protein glycosyltransferase